jgi:hypothetical protein
VSQESLTKAALRLQYDHDIIAGGHFKRIHLARFNVSMRKITIRIETQPAPLFLSA